MHSDWQLAHLGIPVADLDQAIERYSALGATFREEFRIDSSRVEEYLVYGQVPDPVVITRGIMGEYAGVPVELLQPVQGHTVHRELLEQSGEGVGHLAYYVDDIEKEKNAMEALGCPVILSIRHTGQSVPGAVYMDTRGKLSNLITEFIQKQH